MSHKSLIGLINGFDFVGLRDEEDLLGFALVVSSFARFGQLFLDEVHVLVFMHHCVVLLLQSDQFLSVFFVVDFLMGKLGVLFLNEPHEIIDLIFHWSNCREVPLKSLVIVELLVFLVEFCL